MAKVLPVPGPDDGLEDHHSHAGISLKNLGIGIRYELSIKQSMAASVCLQRVRRATHLAEHIFALPLTSSVLVDNHDVDRAIASLHPSFQFILRSVALWTPRNAHMLEVWIVPTFVWALLVVRICVSALRVHRAEPLDGGHTRGAYSSMCVLILQTWVVATYPTTRWLLRLPYLVDVLRRHGSDVAKCHYHREESRRSGRAALGVGLVMLVSTTVIYRPQRLSRWFALGDFCISAMWILCLLSHGLVFRLFFYMARRDLVDIFIELFAAVDESHKIVQTKVQYDCNQMRVLNRMIFREMTSRSLLDSRDREEVPTGSTPRAGSQKPQERTLDAHSAEITSKVRELLLSSFKPRLLRLQRQLAEVFHRLDWVVTSLVLVSVVAIVIPGADWDPPLSLRGARRLIGTAPVFFLRDALLQVTGVACIAFLAYHTSTFTTFGRQLKLSVLELHHCNTHMTSEINEVIDRTDLSFRVNGVPITRGVVIAAIQTSAVLATIVLGIVFK